MEIKQTKFSASAPARRANRAGASSQANDFQGVQSSLSDVSVGNAAPTSSISGIDVVGLFDLTIHPDQQKKKAIHYGEGMLEKLENFRHQLILGAVTPDLLKELRMRLDAMPLSQMDPKLRSIIEDIRIRAEVELAKLGF